MSSLKLAVFKFSVPLLSELLFNIGKIKRNKIIELQRSDLVGQYLRSTTEKTSANTNEAWGGVLFVDEAYHLIPSEDFGQASIEELMAVMEDGYPIMIFAGYDKKMDKVLDVNPGLRSRIYRKFVFIDYSTDELQQIFYLYANEKGFTINQVDIKRILGANGNKRGGCCGCLYTFANVLG